MKEKRHKGIDYKIKQVMSHLLGIRRANCAECGHTRVITFTVLYIYGI